MARLFYKNGPYPGMYIELRPGVNRIGRGTGNDFQIPDISVSSSHCEIQVADIGVFVRDLNSTNGTFIDGRRITKEMLLPGKLLRLGDVEFDYPGAGAPHVAIPERPKVELPHANFLPDGTAACQKHADVAATQKCAKCEKTWCDQCVRKTGLAGSARVIVSCIECGGGCTPIVYKAAPKKSIMGWIGETMRMIKPK